MQIQVRTSWQYEQETTTMKRGLQRKHLALKDGRNLSYIVDQSISGTADRDDSFDGGTPWIFFFPGMFGKADDFVHKKPFQTNCVFVDRPGYGKSDRVPNTATWTYGMFANDIEALAEHLEISQYYVAGHSSGGPCALACGAHNPDSVLGIMVIAGDPEYAAQGAPKETPLVDWLQYKCVVPSIVCLLSAGNMCGYFAGRLNGAKADYAVERRPYDFRTESIHLPTLFVQGSLDTDIPPKYTEFTHQRVENSELMTVTAADHLSIVSFKNLETAIERLLSMTAGNKDEAGGQEVSSNNAVSKFK